MNCRTPAARPPAMVDLIITSIICNTGRDGTYRGAKDGSIPAVKIGGRYLVPTAKLADMLGMNADQIAETVEAAQIEASRRQSEKARSAARHAGAEAAQPSIAA